MPYDHDLPAPAAGRFSAVVDIYDRFRPPPPAILAPLLTGYLGGRRPGRVVDIGCGTGLSTRFWANQAGEVIGVDPSPDMLQRARGATTQENVSYLQATGERTGLPDACADIVVCANCLHWLDTRAALPEFARLLRDGGVFAAYYDNQYPLTLNWEADRIYYCFRERVLAMEARLGNTASLRRSSREQHQRDIEESGLFRFQRQLCVHSQDSGDAERLLGLSTCDGYVRSLLDAGVSETEIGLDRLRSDIRRVMGSAVTPWLWTVNLWIALR